MTENKKDIAKAQNEERTCKEISEMTDEELQNYLDMLSKINSNEVGGLSVQLREEQEKRKAKKEEELKRAEAEKSKRLEERNKVGAEMLKNVGKYYRRGDTYFKVVGIRLDLIGCDLVYECRRAMEYESTLIGYRQWSTTELTLTQKEFESAVEITDNEFYDVEARRRRQAIEEMNWPFKVEINRPYGTASFNQLWNRIFPEG